MKRLLYAIFATALLGLSAPASASAQFSIVVGGGATLPMGEFADGVSSINAFETREPAKTGWFLSLAGLFEIGGSGLSLGGRGLFGMTGHGKVNVQSVLLGGFVVAEYVVGVIPFVSPYVYAGVGGLAHEYSAPTVLTSQGDLSARATMLGAGLGWDIGGPTFRVDGSWINAAGEIDGTDFIAIAASMRMPFGGR